MLLWGKHDYQKLPMGVFNSPDIFQENISKIFEVFDTLRAHTEIILTITKKISELPKGPI